MLRRLTAAILALALAWVPAAPAGALTLEEERKIGGEAFEEVLAQLPLIKDPEILGYVRGLAKRLEEKQPSDPFDYRFYVANVGEMNAFALPGGWIVLYAGMIANMENEAELAGVMAHEMSHVHYRHISERIKKSGPVSAATMAGMLAGMLLGALAGAPELGQAVTMGSMAGGIQKQLSFSRQQEEQADYGAFRLLTKAGFPPQEMEKSYKRIWREQRYTMPQVPEYLLTHPTSPARLEALQNLVRRHGSQGSFDNHDFLRMRTRLVALYDSEDSARRLFERQIAEKSTADMGYLGLALLNMRQSRFDLALRHLELLTGRWAKEPSTDRTRGICHLRLGQTQKAIVELSQCLAQRPEDTLALTALGEAYEQEGKLDQAALRYRRVLEMEPDNDDARHRLGVALGKAGLTSEASLHLGLSFHK